MDLPRLVALVIGSVLVTVGFTLALRRHLEVAPRTAREVIEVGVTLLAAVVFLLAVWRAAGSL